MQSSGDTFEEGRGDGWVRVLSPAFRCCFVAFCFSLLSFWLCLGRQVYVIYCDAKTKPVVEKHIRWAESPEGKKWLAEQEKAKAARKVNKAAAAAAAQ